MAHSCSAGHGCHDLESCEASFESLYSSIDLDQVTCLNEQVSGSVKSVFRPFSLKDDTTKHVDSDADEQLLIFVPFSANVCLRTLTLVAPHTDAHPRHIKLFTNRNDVDFEKAASLPPVAELDVHPDGSGVCDYSLRAALFQGLQSLTLFIESNHGADSTSINFLGLKGSSTKVVRDTIITVAEVAARPVDHKLELKANSKAAAPMVNVDRP